MKTYHFTMDDADRINKALGIARAVLDLLGSVGDPSAIKGETLGWSCNVAIEHIDAAKAAFNGEDKGVTS